MKFNNGAELDKQIYKEGESTWGCKSGVLDVEDAKDFIEVVEELITQGCMGTSANCYQIKKKIRDKSGDSLYRGRT